MDEEATHSNKTTGFPNLIENLDIQRDQNNIKVIDEIQKELVDQESNIIFAELLSVNLENSMISHEEQVHSKITKEYQNITSDQELTSSCTENQHNYLLLETNIEHIERENLEPYTKNTLAAKITMDTINQTQNEIVIVGQTAFEIVENVIIQEAVEMQEAEEHALNNSNNNEFEVMDIDQEPEIENITMTDTKNMSKRNIKRKKNWGEKRKLK